MTDDPSLERPSCTSFWETRLLGLPTRRFWMLVALGLGTCVMIAGFWTIRSSEKTFRRNLESKLDTILRVETEAIVGWVQSKENVFRYLSRNLPNLGPFAQSVRDTDLGSSSTTVSRLDQSGWAQELQVRLQGLGIKDLFLLDVTGKPVYESSQGIFDSISDKLVETDLPQRTEINYLTQQDSKPLSQNPAGDRSSNIYLIGQIPRFPESQEFYSPRTHRTHPAFLGIRLEITDDLTRIVQSSRMGRTGETLVFDSGGQSVSQSRFGKVELPNDLIRLILNGGQITTTGLAEFRDSRGQTCIGVCRWMPEFGLGVLTKMDSSEAFAPIKDIRQFIFALCTLLFLTAIALLILQYLNYRQTLLRQQQELKQQQFGMYQLEQKIGEGGMGIVFRASHRMLARDTAVKILPPEKSSDRAILRFEREVQFTSQLRHPNTISIYDYGRTENGVFYYAMEYVDGLDLDQLVQHSGYLPDGRVVHILEQICQSLGEAHETGLVHRDIKPPNIMICNQGGLVDHVKVLDFGMVRDTTHSRDSRQRISGTPSFMPPEALTKKVNIDHRFDLFSIGAVGFFLLTGTQLREQVSFAELIAHCEKLTEKEIEARLSQFVVNTEQTIDLSLIQVIAKSLAPNVNDRFSDIAEFRSNLLACQITEPWRELEAKQWWQKANLDKAKDLHSTSPWLSPTVTREMRSIDLFVHPAEATDDSDLPVKPRSKTRTSDDLHHDVETGIL